MRGDKYCRAPADDVQEIVKELLQKLKGNVIETSKNPSFVHHDWFVEYHLKFVEQISLELCDIYKDADKDKVLALVWIHDYAKILDKSREHEAEMMEKGRNLIIELGFPEDFADPVLELLKIFESKMDTDLRNAPIEVQIVSSADAASHLIGPFFSLYYRENCSKSISDLQASNRAKLKKDWERKMVLPEVREAFNARYMYACEQAGDFPDKFL